MKHYIDKTTKEIFSYEEDGSQDNYIKSGLVPISNADLEKLRKEQEQARLDALTYSEKRQAEYPSIQEQLDMQYWDKVNGTTNWEDAIAKVKADNPKS